MKKIYTLVALSFFALSSCSDEEPPGPQGPPGEPGVNIVGQTFEYEGIDFNYSSETGLHSIFLDIPGEVEVLESDAILAYRLEMTQDGAGQAMETWSLIPQNYFLNEGIIQYVYNHSDVDIELIIDGNFDLSNLDPGFTQDQVFRFVVIPSDYAQASELDFSNMKAVLNTLNIKASDIKKVSVKD